MLFRSAEEDSADERPVQVARKAPKKGGQFGVGARGPHPLAKGEFRVQRVGERLMRFGMSG